MNERGELAARINDAWHGISLGVEFHGISYPNTMTELAYGPLDFGWPTDEEREAGHAHRVVEVTPDEAWRWSTCLDCGLPLPGHPVQRRERAWRVFCWVARARRRLAR